MVVSRGLAEDEYLLSRKSSIPDVALVDLEKLLWGLDYFWQGESWHHLNATSWRVKLSVFNTIDY